MCRNKSQIKKTQAPVALDFTIYLKISLQLYDNSLSFGKHVGENEILTKLLHFDHDYLYHSTIVENVFLKKADP